MRVDLYLTQYGYARSRSHAAQLISQGVVLLDGSCIRKAGETVDETIPHSVLLTDQCPYVGRGGLKLARALEAFEIDCRGKTALDVGASTGGFTDCLLQRGAAHVFAVDAGAGQLAPTLREDARVTSIEHCNARYLERSMLGSSFPAEGVPLAVMDVSFISQTLILPALLPLLTQGAALVTLIKPQFEAGRSMIGKGGIVRSPQARRASIERVLECAAALSLAAQSLIVSPIEGGDGNVEYLLYLKKESRNDGTASEMLLRRVGL